jgi:hypothetical protein
MSEKNHHEHLGDYERAIFYYTIPQVTSPVTVRVVAVYSFLLVAAFGVLAYGLHSERSEFVTWGTAALGVIIVVGIVAFLFHAFSNQLAEDKALRAAKNIPDADSAFDDIPDPFSDHLLLCVSRHGAGKGIQVVDRKGHPQYVLPGGRSASPVRVDNADGEEVLRLEARSGGVGFTVSRGTPSRITVSADGERIAQIRRKVHFGPEKVAIAMADDGVPGLEVLGGGVYAGATMVGRVYEARGNVYLDVEKRYFNNGLLAYYLLMA